MFRLLYQAKTGLRLRTPFLGGLTLPEPTMLNTPSWPHYPFVIEGQVVFLLDESYFGTGVQESCA